MSVIKLKSRLFSNEIIKIYLTLIFQKKVKERLHIYNYLKLFNIKK